MKKDINCFCFFGIEKDILIKLWLGIGLIIFFDNLNDKIRGLNVLYLYIMIRSKY